MANIEKATSADRQTSHRAYGLETSQLGVVCGMVVDDRDDVRSDNRGRGVIREELEQVTATLHEVRAIEGNRSPIGEDRAGRYGVTLNDRAIESE